MNVNLVLFKKNGTRKDFSLPSTVTVVGRRQDCDLCVPLMVISRRHCELNMDQGQLKVRDLGSRNGTFLNDRKIEEETVNPGDKLQIGPLCFIAQIEGKPEAIEAPVIDSQNVADSTVTDKSAQNHGETFAGLDNVNATGGQNATEVFKIVSQEPISNNNT